MAVATAVMTGALLVGDSMRGSLRSLTIARLGQITHLISPGGFFPVDGVMREIEAAAEMENAPPSAVAVIFFPGASIEASMDGRTRRDGGVQVLGIDEYFWPLSSPGLPTIVDRLDGVGDVPDDQSVFLNESLATSMGVKLGDNVTVRLPAIGIVPADSPLGDRDIQTESLPRMRVAAIVSDDGLGRFALAPSQSAPSNVFLRRQTVAELFDRDGQANLLLMRRHVDVGVASDALATAGSTADTPRLQIGLDALGLRWTTVRRPEPKDLIGEAAEKIDRAVVRYDQLSGDQLLLSDEVVDQVTSLHPSATPVLTYLATAIDKIDQEGQSVASIPYSLISGIDSGPTLPLDYGGPTANGPAAESPTPMVIHSWLAERLDAKAGDRLKVFYFEPEVESGREIERSFVVTVSDVVPLTEPARRFTRSRNARFDQPPTIFNDPNLTPSVPGLTDKDSISDWDAPFPMTRDVSLDDDTYVQNHRLTPKAFLPLAEAQQRFASRFGRVTSVRFSPGVVSDREVLESLSPRLGELGWQPIAIADAHLAASAGTTPFDGLFLSLSFFVIVSAALLIAMLLRLSLAGRSAELGTMLAVGWTPRRLTGLLMTEVAIIGCLGVALGTLGGLAYGSFIIEGLRSRWVGAVATPFLNFYVTPRSLIVGAIAGMGVALAVGWWTLRGLTRRNVLSLRQSSGLEDSANATPSRRPLWVAMVLALAAVGVMADASRRSAMAAAGGFVGGGMLLLAAFLLAVLWRLRGRRKLATSTPSREHTLEPGPGKSIAKSSVRSLLSLAASAGRRTPLRNVMAMGLIAVAAFLIVSMAAFELAPTESGAGGFDLLASASHPIAKDLGDPEVRSGLLGRDAGVLEAAHIESLRRRRGQDASCTNLYRAAAPTVLGIGENFGRRPTPTPFEWAAAEMPPDSSQSESAENQPNPWRLLTPRHAGTEDDPVPVVIDQNTAMWSLGLRGGIGQVTPFTFDDQTIHFRVVGLLANSVLQGSLLIGRGNFESLFPDISGDSMFLIDLNPTGASEVDPGLAAEVLEDRLGDAGMDVRTTESVLRDLLAVQNTYLKTFQTLGALGLLLGTIGLALAQWRSVLTRTKELATMRAIGFGRSRLGWMIVGETSIVLFAGIGIGIACALLALMPSLLGGTNTVWWPPVRSLVGVAGFGLLASIASMVQAMRTPMLGALRDHA